jgi:tRNA-specific 2-thiouridylase
MSKSGKKVLVALSGGVDSSVSAALLKDEGYEVHGAFIKTWTAPWMPCTWREERRDAMRVAALLHIPFHTIDLSKEYEEQVVQYLIDEYKKGRTPNPDVMCNKHIKFGGFFDWAMNNRYNFVATGHYAQRSDKDGKTLLLAGKDEKKDQTYFLWTLTQEHLRKTLFPVGGFEKKKVRELAESYKLPTASKKDSQGICFLGKVDMKDFLKHYIPPEQGNVLDIAGEVIGHHDGAVFVTLGQRHGFTITKKTPESRPQYVVEKNIHDNTVTVAEENNKVTEKNKEIYLTDVNWIGQFEKDCSARLRYNQPLFEVRVQKDVEQTYVVPKNPQPYVPKGQSMVFYKNGVCLGGGIIS